MGDQTATSSVARVDENLPQLPHLAPCNRCFEADLRTDGRAVRDRADKPDLQPRVRVPVSAIEEVLLRSVGSAIGDEKVEKTIIVVISPGAIDRVAPILDEASSSDP